MPPLNAPYAIEHFPKGRDLLRQPRWNKGSAFTEEERRFFHLEGLLPPQVFDLNTQISRVLKQLSTIEDDLERYMLLMSLASRNQTLFYRLVIDHIDCIMPLIYTPTVGQACETYGHIYQHPHGVYLSWHQRGQLKRILSQAASPNIQVIVVTDGERILGLGDLGAYGMGIPVGKLALYSACAGIDPQYTLPVLLDVGSNNKTLLDDPLYTGIHQDRVRGEAYDDFIEEFVQAVQHCFPDALIQFEDFANLNAFRLLEKYRNRACVFNDDIQGTGAVALAGIYAALRITQGKLTEQRFLFLGAGEAAMGIADSIVTALQAEGFSLEAARACCYLVDSKGLIQAQRPDLNSHKQHYAHPHAAADNFLEAVKSLQPTAIIGVSGQAGAFSAAVLQEMAACNQHPIIFALSNPTSRAECSATEAYYQTQGRAIFASGSPFEPVRYGERLYRSGQGNNAYIFPGVGLAIISCQIRQVEDILFFVAAKTLANTVEASDLDQGRVYPALKHIRGVSLKIAIAVAEKAYELGLAELKHPNNLAEYIAEQVYQPVYPNYLEADTD